MYSVDTSSHVPLCGEELIVASFTVDRLDRVYITNPCNGTIHVFDSHSPRKEQIAMLELPDGLLAISMAVDSEGLIWFDDQQFTKPEHIYALDPRSGRIVHNITLPSPAYSIIGLAIDHTRDDSLWVSGDNYVVQVDRNGTLLSILDLSDPPNLVEIYQTAVDPVTRCVLLAANIEGRREIDSFILVWDPDTTSFVYNISFPHTDWLFLSTGVAASNSTLYVTDWNLSRMLLYSREGTMWQQQQQQQAVTRSTAGSAGGHAVAAATSKPAPLSPRQPAHSASAGTDRMVDTMRSRRTTARTSSSRPLLSSASARRQSLRHPTVHAASISESDGSS